MRYLILLCFLFFFSASHAFVPTSSIEKGNGVVKEENNSAKINQKKKIDKKNKKQLKKQTQKLKWQLLKNALKANKSTKKIDKQHKKDAKPIYWASWLSALLGVIAYVLFGIGIGLSGLYFLGALISIPFGIAALVLAIKSIRFMIRNPKSENDTYNKTLSIICTIIGMYFGIFFLYFLIVSLATFTLFIE